MLLDTSKMLLVTSRMLCDTLRMLLDTSEMLLDVSRDLLVATTDFLLPKKIPAVKTEFKIVVLKEQVKVFYRRLLFYFIKPFIIKCFKV